MKNELIERIIVTVVSIAIFLVVCLALTGCGQLKKESICILGGYECEETDRRYEDGEDIGQTGPQGPTGERGEAGPQGASGSPGQDGSSCSVEQLPSGARIFCEDGSEAYIYNGTDGNSCSVEQVVNGAIVSCEDGTSAVVLHGEDGQDAPATEYTFTEIYDPCGDGPGLDEVLFKTAGGEWIAHFAGGGNLQFLTVLSPGNYVTTDSQACPFSLDSQGEIHD